jgi:Pyruvate/2-oxoacid:ferredoxin oxidoreductase delta subunit
MTRKKRIVIDREKCIGCEQCVNACPSGALAMVDGKAQMVGELLCDGLGVCIGECPVDAIQFIEEEVATPSTAPMAHHNHGHAGGGGCPGSRAMVWNAMLAPSEASSRIPSALTHWPVQLRLVNPANPVFQGCDLLVAADCTAFAMGGFHADLLAGKRLVVACPKLDDPTGYIEKLTELVANARPRSITVARMEVPCCMGLVRMVEQAVEQSGIEVEVDEVVIGIDGMRKE